MGVYRTQIFGSQANMGFSEVYWTPDTSPDNAASLISGLAQARFNMLWPVHTMLGVRVSLEGTKRQSTLIVPPGNFFPGTGVFVSLPSQGSGSNSSFGSGPDQLRVALNNRFRLSDGRVTMRYLCGIPDIDTTTDPGAFNVGGSPAWDQTRQKFNAFLVNNAFRLKARLVTGAGAPVKVTGIEQQQAAPGLIGIDIATATAPAIAKGDKISLSGFRAKKGTRASTMNGTWIVDSVNTTLVPDSVTVFLRGSEGIDPAAQRITDMSTLRKMLLDTFPIVGVEWQRAGIHKRGRPTLSPRGRRTKTISLDA